MRDSRFRRAAMTLCAALAFNAARPIFADGSSFGPMDFRRNAAPVSVPSDSGLPPASGAPWTHARAALVRTDAADFHAFVAAHASQGRLLTDAERAALSERLASARADSLRRSPSNTQVTQGPRALREMQAKDAARRDSLARARVDTAARADSARRDSVPDTLSGTRERQADSPPVPISTVVGESREPPGADQNGRDASAVDDEEAKGWFFNLMADFSDDSKDKGLDGHDWAAILYVVVGVVVVGAFLVYGVQTLTELILNDGHYPVFQEVGARLSYSGASWRDGAGADLYRDAYLAGIRYAIGFDRPGMDIGLAAEGGYIDIRLSPRDGLGRSFDFKGAYLVAGPLLRFGDFDPFCFSLEFLNGTSNHASIGWISKSRMALQARIGGHTVAGANLGAVFYDLEFLDGLALRRGDFNRDLSLVGGFDFGWEF